MCKAFLNNKKDMADWRLDLEHRFKVTCELSMENGMIFRLCGRELEISHSVILIICVTQKLKQFSALLFILFSITSSMEMATIFISLVLWDICIKRHHQVFL
jgi:hypothetical protein